MESPQIFRPSNHSDLQELLTSPTIEKKDVIDSQLRELFTIRHPKEQDDQSAFKKFESKYVGEKSKAETGVWVYFPWKHTIVHMLDEDDFYTLRTSRNYPLISHDDQQKLRSLCVAIVGLSVGNSVAVSLAYMGVGSHYKLADFDTLETTNLNRIRAGVLDLDEKKTVIAARQIFEVNPFAKIEVFSDGVTSENFDNFFHGSRNIDILFDECDDLLLKFYLRLAAHSLQLPLIMASDVGYSLDVSCLDFGKKEKTKATDMPPVSFEDVLSGFAVVEPLDISKTDKILLIEELIGQEKISDEMKIALLELADGKIVSYPQLGPIAFMGGGLATLATLAYISFGTRVKESATFDIMDCVVDYPKDWETEMKVWREKYSQLIKDLKKA